MPGRKSARVCPTRVGISSPHNRSSGLPTSRSAGVLTVGRLASTCLASLACLVIILAPTLATAFTWPADDLVVAQRTVDFNGGNVPLNEPVRVSWTIDIETGEQLRGLFFSEFLPDWLTVEGVEANLDGEPVSVLHETGVVGEPMQGLRAHRFAFWDYSTNLDVRVAHGETLELVYHLRSGVTGEASLDFNGWFGRLDIYDSVCVGGYDDASITLRFGDTPLTLDLLVAVAATDHIELRWRLNLTGASQSFRLQRAETADPWASLPLAGSEGHGPGDYSHDDHDVAIGQDYWYWIALLDDQGAVAAHLGPARARLAAPGMALLGQNHPNPFNPTTRISFTLPEAGGVELSIFDAAGRRVRVLAEGIWLAGRHELDWDGRDATGDELPSGIYFARLLSEHGEAQIRKLTLLR